MIPIEKKIKKCIDFVIEKSKIPHDYTNDARIPNFNKLNLDNYKLKKLFPVNPKNNKQRKNFCVKRKRYIITTITN